MKKINFFIQEKTSDQFDVTSDMLRLNLFENNESIFLEELNPKKCVKLKVNFIKSSKLNYKKKTIKKSEPT